jgi:two-component system phosphate regulon response regulator PhoB
MNDALGYSTFKVFKILLVEDEEIVRKVIEIALQDEGFEVTTLADGQLVLDSLSKVGMNCSHLSFDLIDVFKN